MTDKRPLIINIGRLIIKRGGGGTFGKKQVPRAISVVLVTEPQVDVYITFDRDMDTTQAWSGPTLLAWRVFLDAEFLPGSVSWVNSRTIKLANCGLVGSYSGPQFARWVGGVGGTLRSFADVAVPNGTDFPI